MRPIRVLVHAPAKVNLGLELLGRRADGYHEIATLLQAVSVTDTVTLERSTRPGLQLTIRPRGLDLGPIPDNLAMRAASLFAAKTGAVGGPESGVTIGLTKRIPAGAGFGGGSADAAAVLIGLSVLTKREISAEALEAWSGELGSDVPFFIRGGTQLATGRGDHLRPAPRWPGRALLLVFPNRSLATGSIYGAAKIELTPPGPLSSIAYRKFPWDFWSRHGGELRNDLEPAVLEAEPLVAVALQELRGLGAAVAQVTGSGSGVFAVAPDLETAARWSAQLLERGFWARPVRPWRAGCRVRTGRNSSGCGSRRDR